MIRGIEVGDTAVIAVDPGIGVEEKAATTLVIRTGRTRNIAYCSMKNALPRLGEGIGVVGNVCTIARRNGNGRLSIVLGINASE